MAMGTMYIVATPIGNLDDITIRAVKILSSADLVLCEDTRHTGLLLQRLKIQTKLAAYYDEIENRKIPEIIELLESNKNIALVSDAGTPLISDPGFRLVRECTKRGIKVESIPGAAAFLVALTNSGLPPDKFIFLGFVQPKNFTYIQPGVTSIFYSAPHKLLGDLAAIKNKFGNIEIVVARELTKIHEEIWHGCITNAVNYFSKPKGEFVLLFNIPQE